MNKYNIKLSKVYITSKINYPCGEKELDNIIKSVGTSFLNEYSTEEQAQTASISFVAALTKAVFKTVSAIDRLVIRQEKKCLEMDIHINTEYGCLCWVSIYVSVEKIAKTAIVLTKSIFNSNNDYLFSEVVGKADSQTKSETLRNIDKQKFSDSYERNGWKVHYFFNKVEM